MPACAGFLPDQWWRDRETFERELAAHGGSRRAIWRAHPDVAKSTLDEWAHKHGLGAPANKRLQFLGDEQMRSEIEREIPVIRRDYSGHARHRVYPLGDVHLGAATHSGHKWRAWLEYLAGRPSCSMLGTGDFLNTAIIGSKSDIYDERLTVGEAKRLLRRQLRPLAEAGRIDALMPGNHENRITRATGDCPIRDVCDSLEAPYVEAAALLVYTVGDIEYEIYVRHGTGSGQSLAQLAKSGSVIDADVYVTGHTHRQAIAADEIFVRTKGNGIKRKRRMFVSSGSFLGYEKYAAERGYPPSRIGAPRIFLDGRRFDVHVSI